MPRVKRGTIAHKKRGRVLKLTQGFRWGRKSKERAAKEALLHSLSRMARGRKEKKRVFRKLWNVRINAASRNHGVPYGALISGLKRQNIVLNRKMLAELARSEPAVFEAVLKKAVSLKK